MPDPVVHFEIRGEDPAALRRFYAELFGWDAAPGAPVASGVSDADAYSYIEAPAAAGGGIPGGIGGGSGRTPYALFYVGVADVAASLAQAEQLGGTRALGPETSPNGQLVVAHFRDPEGNLVGLAGPVIE